MTWKLNEGMMYVWELSNEMRSMAAAQGPTPNGMRVSWVYTPLALRARGYASAVVAALSQHLLDQGKSFVFLFADLDFPTSNHFYQAIGYEVGCEMNEYMLGTQHDASDEDP